MQLGGRQPRQTLLLQVDHLDQAGHVNWVQCSALMSA